jgi:hypothetical protein
VIIRVPGHDEVLINENKALHLISQKVAAKIEALFLPNLLNKKHVTARQRSNDASPDVERRSVNVKDSFNVDVSYKEIFNKRILIIALL